MYLTKKKYDVNDRIIAKIQGFALNYLGTVGRVLANGGYSIRYDNGNTIDTNHDQILGLTYEYNENCPNAIHNNSLPKHLPRRVSSDSINNLGNIIGNPITKSEYLVGDRVIVRFEDTINDGNYIGTVRRNLTNGYYLIGYDDGSACPAEHIQILGLTGHDDKNTEKIADNQLIDFLRQNINEGPGPGPVIGPGGDEGPKPDSIKRSMMNGSFSVLASVLNERALTESLRYLLDSESPHSLSDKFFHELLDCANIPGIKLQNKEKLIISASSEWHTDDHKRVDILVVAKSNLCESPVIVLGIEGKITAFESQEQLSSYQTRVYQLRAC